MVVFCFSSLITEFIQREREMGAKKYAFNCVVFHPGEEKNKEVQIFLGWETYFLVTSFLHISYNMFGQHRRFRHLLQLKPTQIYHIQMSQDPVCELFVCFCSILDLEPFAFFHQHKMHLDQCQSLQSKMHQCQKWTKNDLRCRDLLAKLGKGAIFTHLETGDKQKK